MDTIKKEEQILLGLSCPGVLGEMDCNLRKIQDETDADIFVRDGIVSIKGVSGEVEKGKKIFLHLKELVDAGVCIDEQTLNYAIASVEKNSEKNEPSKLTGNIFITSKGKAIKGRTYGQCRYVELLKNNDIVFAVGPAGTGKTYLAVVQAVASLKRNEVRRIVLTRPAVEAGEKLGFLPGDLQDKVDPYLRPLYDSLYDVLGADHSKKMLEKGIIEVAPLAYMRGRTLDDAFIILDEAQNTTIPQMKMFLTRIGFGSKAVVTGDVTQIDLGKGETSGLLHAQKILKNIPGIGFAVMTNLDVVRHPLVQKIIDAYERSGNDEK